MNGRNSIEHDMQVQLINDCNVLFGYKYRELLIEIDKLGFVAPIFSVPNSGFGILAGKEKDKNLIYRVISYLRKEGLRSGVPDLVLPVPACGYHGLFIELKQGKNKPSDNQLRWHILLSYLGYRVVVCYSKADAINLIIEYMKGYKKHE